MLMCGEDQERRRGYGPGQEVAGLRATPAGYGANHQIFGESLGEYHLRTVAYQDGRDVAGKLPGTAADAGSYESDSGRGPVFHDRENYLRDFDGGVEVHAERRLAVNPAGRDGYGVDGRPSLSVHRKH